MNLAWLNRHFFIRLYAVALIVFLGGLILWSCGYLNMTSVRLQLAAIGLWLFLVVGGLAYWFAAGGRFKSLSFISRKPRDLFVLLL